jgi:hypothetical protein
MFAAAEYLADRRCLKVKECEAPVEELKQQAVRRYAPDTAWWRERCHCNKCRQTRQPILAHSGPRRCFTWWLQVLAKTRLRRSFPTMHLIYM